MKKTLLAALLLSCVALNLPGTVEAAGQVPTNIKSGSMEYSGDAQTVNFIGKVHVKRPDFELWSDKLTVYLKKDKAASPSADEKKDDAVSGMQAGEIDRIVATGNVRMKSGDREGRCSVATYYTATDKFVMEGSPVLREKDNVVKGSTITHFLKQNRSQVSGGEFTFMAPDNSEGMSLSPGKGKK